MPNLLQRLFEDPEVVRERERIEKGLPEPEAPPPQSNAWQRRDTIAGLAILAVIIGVVASILTTWPIGISIAVGIYFLMLLTVIALKE